MELLQPPKCVVLPDLRHGVEELAVGTGECVVVELGELESRQRVDHAWRQRVVVAHATGGTQLLAGRTMLHQVQQPLHQRPRNVGGLRISLE